MKLVIANPLDRTSMGYRVIQEAWRLAKQELRLDKYPDKKVILMLDGEAGDTAMHRASLKQSAVLGATDQGFDSDGYIRIMVAKLDDARIMIQSLLHELVHVEQSASGRMVQMDDGTAIYEGREYNNIVGAAQTASYSKLADNIATKRTEYEELPWETEARAKSEKMIRVMDEHMRQRGELVEL